ncbi:hypothetical protein EDE15_4952 [Edaphobacter aggregans]|uniref:Uncharacterized protein n=1 Tax=Edaphobacter aggregans TaxID=570835 RepID=A0A428MR11_9BACT|nr:hypothetical protein [Edaphobacter aggregans]RSL19290.1 hypothetical protein EDE15_4952 [Edaphobacter aggregans]
MAQSGSGDVRLAFRTAARSALITFCVVVCGQVAKALINDLFDGRWRVDWKFILVISGFAGVVVLIWTFVSGYFSLRAAAPADAILGRDPSISTNPNEAMSGFVGMEYYGLILNRTYLVFAAPDGLYGWKVEGPVSAARPQFYEPYKEMLDDPKLMRDRGAVKDLAKLKGGFFIPGSEIAYVEATDKSKWGMGGIPHSGRIRIGLTTGKWREFILLGSVSPEVIRDRILSSAASVRV